jgi:hypothetical protein
MEYFYMLSDDTLPKFMQQSLDDVYTRMAVVSSDREFQHLLHIAPSFLFVKTNDYLQAIKSDAIVVLVPPDKHYEFEVLIHDTKRNRVVIDSMEFKRITEDKFKELMMDNYPMLAMM